MTDRTPEPRFLVARIDYGATVVCCVECEVKLGVPKSWWWLEHHDDGSHTVHTEPAPRLRRAHRPHRAAGR